MYILPVVGRISWPGENIITGFSCSANLCQTTWPPMHPIHFGISDEGFWKLVFIFTLGSLHKIILRITFIVCPVTITQLLIFLRNSPPQLHLEVISLLVFFPACLFLTTYMNCAYMGPCTPYMTCCRNGYFFYIHAPAKFFRILSSKNVKD